MIHLNEFEKKFDVNSLYYESKNWWKVKQGEVGGATYMSWIDIYDP